MQWFRFYAEVLNDHKVQTLDPVVFKLWINCLCLAANSEKNDGNLGTLTSVSFAIRETQESVSSAFHELLTRGIIGTVGETFHISNWKKRQYKSDTSTERVKRYRKRYETVSVTAPDTDTDTDTEREKESPLTPVNGGNFNNAKTRGKNGTGKIRSGAEAANLIVGKIERGENLG